MLSSFARVLLLAACASSVLALPEPSRTTRDLSDLLHPIGVVTKPLSLKDAVPLTNGQRFARGLPPNPPRRRSKVAIQPRQSSTCVTQTGHIAVSGGPGGYVSSTVTSFGEYSSTIDISSALLVSFCVDTTGAVFELQTKNGLSSYNFFGVVQGSASASLDLSIGSHDHFFLAGTAQVAHGPATQVANSFSAAAGTDRAVESSIWTLSSDNKLVPSFVNSDGSTVTPSIEWVPSSSAFAITGDASAFSAAFGGSETVTFTFVSA